MNQSSSALRNDAVTYVLLGLHLLDSYIFNDGQLYSLVTEAQVFINNLPVFMHDNTHKSVALTSYH